MVLTIAGSDSGGGAGIQADLKTIEACGGFGTAAVTAVTAQNTTGVHGTHVLPVEEVEAQLDAVITDFDVAAVKTGMLATAEMVETVTRYVAGLDCPVVVDPVMVAASGDRLLDEDAEDAYEGSDVGMVPAYTRLLAGVRVNEMRATEFQTPLIHNVDQFRPLVWDEASDEVLEFPPLGEFRQHL